MTETQIEILIKAIDEVSATLNKIDNNVNAMAKSTEKSAVNIGQAFKQTQGDILVLGQAALATGDIFDTYENTQIRVENASIKVYEAQKNVRDAQYALNKTMQDGTATAEDIAKAQDDLESATNRLTIAENSLDKANGDVWKSWVQMGMQSLVLISSLPTVISSVVQLTTGTWALIPALYAQAVAFGAITIAGAPLWLIILGIIAAVALIVVAFKNWDKITKVLGDGLMWLKENVLDPVWNFLKDMYQWIKDKFLDAIEKVSVGVKKVGSVLGLGESTEQYTITQTPTSASAGNINVKIDNVYGMDASQVSSALNDTLSTQIRGYN